MMSRILVLLAAVLMLAACGVPEVDLDLPERPPNQENVSQVAPDPPVSGDGSAGGTAAGQNEDPASAVSPPDPGDLDELEQLVSEIEALLEGVSEELEQIDFEEEGG